MEIKKESRQYVTDDTGSVINVGEEVVFSDGDKSYTAVFAGITERGALRFKGYFGEVFNMMPRSITKIKRVNGGEKNE